MDSDKNKKRTALDWYYEHREEQIQKNREWKIKNRERMLAQKKEYHLKNRDEILERKKQYRLNNQEKLQEYNRRPDVMKKARERVLKKRIATNYAYDRAHNKLPEVKARRNETSKIWKKNNPRSANHGSYELQDAMNNVRVRDNNTCQWQGCGLTFREAPIHVHHIFPKSEYPDYELVEQYMICYCLNHHWMWHKYRGDNYAKLLSYANRDNSFDLVRGSD